MSFKKRLALTFLASVLAFFYGYLIVTYWQLPAKVATHFDFAGNPDGEMTRSQYAWTMGLTQCGVTGLLVLMAFMTSALPDWAINIPRKKYWLAAERRATSLETLSVYLLWVSVLTAGFLFTTTWQIDRANLQNAKQPDSMFYIVSAAFLALILLLTALLFLKFAKIDKTQAGSERGSE